MLEIRVFLATFIGRTEEVQTVDFAILFSQEEQRARRRCSVNRGNVPNEWDPSRLRDRARHGRRILLGQAFVRGLFIYGVNIFALLKPNVWASEMAAPAIGRGVPQKQHRQCRPTGAGAALLTVKIL